MALGAALHHPRLGAAGASGANLRTIDPAEHAAPLFVDAIGPAYEEGAVAKARASEGKARGPLLPQAGPLHAEP